MDIDEILARAEKVETKATNEVEGGNELLNAFKVLFFCPSFVDKRSGNGFTCIGFLSCSLLFGRNLICIQIV